MPPLISMERSSRQKIRKEIMAFNAASDQIDLGIYRTFPPQTADYTLFSQGTFSRIDHILGHIARLSKFKKIEIISRAFCGHTNTKLEEWKKHKHTPD